VSVRGAGGGI